MPLYSFSYVITFCSFILFLIPAQLFGLATESDLDLDGASITGFAKEGDMLFATAESPKGIYVSSNFGGSWAFAGGGSYTVGAGRGVVTTSNRVFAILAGRLYTSPLTSPLLWDEVELDLAEEIVEESELAAEEILDAEELFSIATDGTFVFVASNHGHVRVIHSSTLSQVHKGTPVTLMEPRSLASLAVDSTTGFVWVLVGEAGQADSRIYRSGYNSTTGILGSWSNATPSLLETNTGRVGGVFSDQNGTLYVTTFGASNTDAGIYRSTDNGSSYTKKDLPSTDSASLNIRGASFRGTTHFIGAYISFDSGQTFENGRIGETASGDLLNQRSVFIDSDDATRAIGSAAVGPITTQNLDNGLTSTWSPAYSGLRGIRVNDVDQSLLNPGTVVLALESGLARTTNFTDDAEQLTTATINWTYPILIEDFSTPVFSVELDPENDKTLYVGTGTFYRGMIDDEGDFTWTDVTGDSTPGKNIVDISIAKNTILLATAQVSGALDGNVRVLDRNSLEVRSTALEGLPVSAVLAVSDTLLFAGVGGIPSLENESGSNQNLGLYRSTDGGLNWAKIDSYEDLNELGVSILRYDDTRDILYAATYEPDGGGGDEEDDDDVSDDEDDELPTLLVLHHVSKKKISVTLPGRGLPVGTQVTALEFSSKDGAKKIYAAADGNIYESESTGKTWSLFYDGLSEEVIHVLFFDALLRASNAGFSGLSGFANLIVSKITGKLSGGSRDKVKITFNRPISKSRAQKRRIRASTSRGFSTRTRFTRGGNVATISPRGQWPESGSLNIRIQSSFQTADKSENIDSDYDGTQGGRSYRKVLRLK